MQVVVAGLGRTGTMSINAALQQLGLRTLNQETLIADGPRLLRVIEMVRGEQPFDAEVLHGTDATVGWPLCWLYEEQLAHWPDARCVLNVRDPDAWFTSVSRAFKVISPLRYLPFPPKARLVDAMLSTAERQLGGRIDRDLWTRGYREHIERVKSTVPEDRLLVYEIGSGWGPMCEFLELDVPETDFPRGNSSGNSEFTEKIKSLIFPR